MFMTPPDQLEYSEDGIDLTLIRWMLSLTPAERLEFHERQSKLILNSPGIKCGADGFLWGGQSWLQPPFKAAL